MTDSKQADGRRSRGKTPGRFSRWMQQRTNSRTITRIRRGKATFMGMDLLVLHTVGRRTGQPRQSPVTWFDDGDGSSRHSPATRSISRSPIGSTRLSGSPRADPQPAPRVWETQHAVRN